MPKIKMTQNALGANADADGKSHGVKMYFDGHEHEVCDRLAKDFCDNMKVAKRVSEPKVQESKASKGAPENKAN